MFIGLACNSDLAPSCWSLHPKANLDGWMLQGEQRQLQPLEQQALFEGCSQGFAWLLPTHRGLQQLVLHFQPFERRLQTPHIPLGRRMHQHRVGR